MSDEKDRGTESLIPFVGGEIVSRSSSLVRRGLNLLEAQKPTEDATVTQLRENGRMREMALLSSIWAWRTPSVGACRRTTRKPRSGIAKRLSRAMSRLRSVWAGRTTTVVACRKTTCKPSEWYRKAAEQGNATAQCNLGVAYDHGRGVPQDDVQAVHWYSQSC